MSPEQARGEKLDARTDLFSFGAVLYEMATAQQAFSGATTVVIFDGILHKTPTSPLQLNTALPQELERIISKALEKDRDLRCQTAAELRTDLKRLKRDTESPRVGAGLVPAPSAHGAVTAPAGHPQRLPLRRRWPLALAGLLALIAVSGLVWFATHRAPPPAAPELKEQRLTAIPGENALTQGVISPDGKYLAYGDRTGIHLKLIQSGEILNIPQPGGRALDEWWPNAWFPDGTKFIASGVENPFRVSTWIISALGGPPRKIRDDADGWAVSPDGTLIAFGAGQQESTAQEDLWVMGANGEEPRKLASTSSGGHIWQASWSPDGRRIAYRHDHSTPGGRECSIESGDLSGGQPMVILSDSRLCDFSTFALWWSPSGRLVYGMADPNQSGGNLWEIQVDPKTGEGVGKPKRITNWTEADTLSISGTADGKRLAVTKHSAQWDVYVGQLEAGGRRLTSARRLTLEERDDLPGAWTPDSKAVLFWSNRNGTFDLFRQAIDQDFAEPVVTGPGDKRFPVVSPDGSWILYIATGVGSGVTRIMHVPTLGGPAEMVLEDRGIDRAACARHASSQCVFSATTLDQKEAVFSAFDPTRGRGRELVRVDLKPTLRYGWDLSPDGSRLAFTQPDDRGGRIQILPLASAKATVVNVNGWNALWDLRWAADGKALFVGTTRGELLYVDMEGRAEVLWQQRVSSRPAIFGVPSPDGRHLAMLGGTAENNVWMLEGF